MRVCRDPILPFKLVWRSHSGEGSDVRVGRGLGPASPLGGPAMGRRPWRGPLALRDVIRTDRRGAEPRWGGVEGSSVSETAERCGVPRSAEPDSSAFSLPESVRRLTCRVNEGVTFGVYRR